MTPKDRDEEFIVKRGRPYAPPTQPGMPYAEPTPGQPTPQGSPIRTPEKPKPVKKQGLFARVFGGLVDNLRNIFRRNPQRVNRQGLDARGGQAPAREAPIPPPPVLRAETKAPSVASTRPLMPPSVTTDDLLHEDLDTESSQGLKSDYAASVAPSVSSRASSRGSTVSPRDAVMPLPKGSEKTAEPLSASSIAQQIELLEKELKEVKKSKKENEYGLRSFIRQDGPLKSSEADLKSAGAEVAKFERMLKAKQEIGHAVNWQGIEIGAGKRKHEIHDNLPDIKVIKAALANAKAELKSAEHRHNNNKTVHDDLIRHIRAEGKNIDRLEGEIKKLHSQQQRMLNPPEVQAPKLPRGYEFKAAELVTRPGRQGVPLSNQINHKKAEIQSLEREVKAQEKLIKEIEKNPSRFNREKVSGVQYLKYCQEQHKVAVGKLSAARADLENLKNEQQDRHAKKDTPSDAARGLGDAFDAADKASKAAGAEVEDEPDSRPKLK